MSFNRLENCTRCGELFVLINKDICPHCVKKVEHEFEICSQFLRKKENRSSSITEMSENTGVSIYQITEFIREKRLMIDLAPNLGYPCEGCGQAIRKDRLCMNCTDHWKQAVDGLNSKTTETVENKPKSGYYIDSRKSR